MSYNKRKNTMSEKNHEIFDKKAFEEDVHRGVIVKDLMKKYNVSQYCVIKTKRDLGLLDIRYSNKNKKIVKSV